MRTFRAFMFVFFCNLPLLASSFNAALWRDRLLSENPATQTQALSDMERLSLDEKQQLALALAQPLNTDSASAQKAAAVLAHFGPAAEGIVFNLVEALRYDDPAVAPAVSDALLKIGPGAVKPLQKALQDSNFFVRQHSADILGRFGPRAKRAAPSLVELLKEAQTEVRTAGQNALIQMGPDAVPALSEALRREPDIHRQILVTTLGKCGPDAIPSLLLVLKRDENAYLRANAAKALSQFQPLSANVVVALLLALEDLDEPVRSAAADALGQPSAKAALGSLVLVKYGDKDAVVRAKAEQAITQIGKGGPESMPGFIRALREPDEKIRQDILSLLGQSDSPIAETMPVLGNSIKDPSPAVRLRALQTAGLLAQSSDAALLIYQTALGDSQPEIRALAIQYLGSMRDAPAPAAAELAVVLKDPNPVLRQKAIQALSNLGAPGLPGLIQGFGDSYSMLSEEAAKAILKIGPEAIPMLQPLAEGSNPELSRRAKELIRRLQRSSSTPAR